MTAIVALGKAGDLLSILPIVQHVAETTGETPTVVTSKRYASVLDGFRHAKVDVVETDWMDLWSAISYAKRKYSKVIVPQTYGQGIPIEHRAPSFQHDQYIRAGMVGQWDRLMLDIPRKKIMPQGRTILLADHSESSPFAHREELRAMLVERFGATHNISDLSKIKLDKLRDFLPMFDAAECIVTIDTAFLHLSASTKTPVIALATDRPSRWHGSAWSRRFAFYCRYGEFKARQNELIRAVDNAVNKVDTVRIVETNTAFENGYNPSIIIHDGQPISTYRYHPIRGQWRTRMAIFDGSTHEIKMPSELDDHSIEDGRLFYVGEQLHLSYVASIYPANPLRCVIAYGPLEKVDGQWRVVRHIQPKFGKNDFTALEKNWCFFTSTDQLYAIYGSHPQQTTIALNGDKATQMFVTTPPRWGYGAIRGGVVLPFGRGTLIRFFHSLTGDRAKAFSFRYHVGALVMEDRPPFTIRQISSHPIISGHEGWTPGCSHYKPNVVFCCGAVAETDGYNLAIGVNDCSCAVARIGREQLNLIDYEGHSPAKPI